MKLVIKALVLAVSVSTLAGCAAPPPPTPPALLADADLCAETGYQYARGNSNRLQNLMAEGRNRAARKSFKIDEATCRALADTGVNRAQQERAEQTQNAQNWQNFSAGMAAASNQMQMQQQQQQMRNDQLMQQSLQQSQQFQQQMQMQQQTQALQSIDRTLRGY